MARIFDRPSERQTKESELKRPLSQAFALIMIRITIIAIFILEIALIGKASGFIIIVVVFVALYLDREFRLGIKKALGKMWYAKCVFAIAIGVILVVLAVTGHWFNLAYHITSQHYIDLPRRRLIGNWTLWTRIILIIGLPLCASLPLRVLDWVMQIELQRPNLRNAPAQRQSVEGIKTPTMGIMHAPKPSQTTIIQQAGQPQKNNVAVTPQDSTQIDL